MNLGDKKEEKVYLCGSSSKDAGDKVCTIIQMNDTMSIELLIAPETSLKC